MLYRSRKPDWPPKVGYEFYEVNVNIQLLKQICSRSLERKEGTGEKDEAKRQGEKGWRILGMGKTIVCFQWGGTVLEIKQY